MLMASLGASGIACSPTQAAPQAVTVSIEAPRAGLAATKPLPPPPVASPSPGPRGCRRDELAERFCRSATPEERDANGQCAATPETLPERGWLSPPTRPVLDEAAAARVETRDFSPCCYSWCTPVTVAEVPPVTSCQRGYVRTTCVMASPAGASIPAAAPHEACAAGFIAVSAAAPGLLHPPASFNAKKTQSSRSAAFPDLCCYDHCSTIIEIQEGRPFVIEGVVVHATVRRRLDWIGRAEAARWVMLPA
jgi:hypothetical protein